MSKRKRKVLFSLAALGAMFTWLVTKKAPPSPEGSWKDVSQGR